MPLLEILKSVLLFFIVAGLAWILTKKKILQKETSHVLSTLLINLIVPAYALYRFSTAFSAKMLQEGLLVLGTALWYAAVAIPLATLLSVFSNYKKEFKIAVIFSNTGYLPISLVTFLASTGINIDQIKLILLILLYVAPWAIFLWTYGYKKLGSEEGTVFNALNPPLVFTFAGVVLGLLGAGEFFKKAWFLKIPFETISAAMVPVMLLCLGSMLAEVESKKFPVKEILLVAMAKFILLPLSAVPVMLLNVPVNVKIVAAFEFCMPPAMNIAVIARYRGGNWKMVSALIFGLYALSIILIPVDVYFLLKLGKIILK